MNDKELVVKLKRLNDINIELEKLNKLYLELQVERRKLGEELGIE